MIKVVEYFLSDINILVFQGQVLDQLVGYKIDVFLVEGVIGFMCFYFI